MGTMLSSILIGVMVMLAIYLSLSRVMDIKVVSVNRALAIFSAAVGLLTAFFLMNNPDVLGRYTQEIVIAGMGVVLALLVFARRIFRG